MNIRELIDKKGSYSKEEKAYIIAEGEKWGVKPPKKTSCSNCWRDMAIEIAYNMRAAEKDKNPHRFRDGSAAERDGVVFKGRIITNDTIDDETWAWMQANGFPQQLLHHED